MISPVTIQIIVASKHNPTMAMSLYRSLIGFFRLYPVSDDEYSEVHHIVPRLLGGGEEPENLVRLPAIAHFDAHMLLAYAHNDQPANIVTQLQGAVRVLLGLNAPTFAQIEDAPEEMRLRYHEARELGEAKFNQNKEQLHAMIARGEGRPHWLTPLGRCVNMYTTPSHKSFRKGFKEELISLGGDHWFQTSRFDQDCAELLDLARDGQPRPDVKTRLGHRLARYVSPKSKDYRPELREQIKVLNPEWFANNRGGRPFGAKDKQKRISKN